MTDFTERLRCPVCVSGRQCGCILRLTGGRYVVLFGCIAYREGWFFLIRGGLGLEVRKFVNKEG